MVDPDLAMAAHRRTWELIPWVINGRASADEIATVETHLETCRDCRDEYQFQKHVSMGVSAGSHGESAGEYDPEPSLQRLWRRIDTVAPTSAVVDSFYPAGRQRRLWLRGLAAAVMIQTVGLSVLGTALWTAHEQGKAAASYRTLSSATAMPSRAAIRLVPTPGLSLGEFQALLAQSKLEVVSGPSESGAYLLAPLNTGDSLERSLEELRAHAGIAFAEPVGSALPARP